MAHGGDTGAEADGTVMDGKTNVVSLVVRTPEHPGKLLMGVRAPTPTSRRHPHVLSTPTMRVPAEILAAAVAAQAPGSMPALSLGHIHTFRPSHSVPFGGAQRQTSGLAFLVESVLAKKVGLSNALVEGNAFGSVALGSLALDLVPDAATKESELTEMLTLVATLDAGSDQIPSSTLSYGQFMWADPAQLQDALAHNDALRVDPNLDLMICIHGLCVKSAATLLASDVAA